MKRDSLVNIFLILLIVASVLLIFFQHINMQGKAIDNFVPSNVSILKTIAISFSSNLASGIIFGDVHVLPSYNISAVHNYDNQNNGSSYYIYVSPDSNSQIDLCIKADRGLTNAGGDVIGIGNESYASSTNSSDVTIPSLNNETSLTLNYSQYDVGVFPGEQNFLRFWLDVPAAQASGTYNNSVYMKAVVSGLSC
jgi:hypothetical protein